MDPRAPGYTALQLYKAGGGPPSEIYASEPRVAAWADGRERDIANYPRAEISRVDPDAKIEVDCTTSSCRVRVYSKNPSLVASMGPFRFACMASSSAADLERRDPDHPELEFADVYVLFGEDNLAEAPFQANREKTCEAYRDAWLKQAAASVTDK